VLGNPVEQHTGEARSEQACRGQRVLRKVARSGPVDQHYARIEQRRDRGRRQTDGASLRTVGRTFDDHDVATNRTPLEGRCDPVDFAPTRPRENRFDEPL
jgi:hypothetical protein